MSDEITRNRQYVDELRVRTAAEDASSQTDRDWMKNELDFIRSRNHKTKAIEP